NNDTWASFSRWNRSAARYAAVAYGGGGHGKSPCYDETFIDELVDRFSAAGLFYFCDIDPRGLHIASRAAKRRTDRQACPLRPATILYKWLLVHGVRTDLKRAERASLADLAWLPEDLRGPVETLFADRQRIPQEALGARVLAKGAVG